MCFVAQLTNPIMKLLIFLLCCVLLCKLAAGHEGSIAILISLFIFFFPKFSSRKGCLASNRPSSLVSDIVKSEKN